VAEAWRLAAPGQCGDSSPHSKIERKILTVDRTLLQERLISIVRRFPQRRILVVGDSVADQFVYGAISRVSRGGKIRSGHVELRHAAPIR